MTAVPPADHDAGWEYLYFAAELARDLATHQSAYSEYQSQVVRPDPTPIPDPSAYIHTLTDEITRAVHGVDTLLSPSVTERAFGLPGQSGDEAAIRELAAGLADIYAEMISWGMKVRGAAVADRWRPVFTALARYVNSPLHQFQDFSATVSASFDRVIGDVRAGRPAGAPLELALRISIDPNASAEFNAAIEALKSGGLASAQPASRPSFPSPPPSSIPVSGTPLERARALPKTSWFPRFAEIPGVAYETPPGIDPTKVPGYGMTPEFSEFDSGGQHYESLMWEYGETQSSATPLQELLGEADVSSLDTLLTWCATGLEMPAEASNYHFHLLETCTQLHKMRRRDQGAIPELERVALLDLALIEAWPRAIYNDYGDNPIFYSAPCFGYLIGLYEGEGALHEALEIAERAAAFGQEPDRREEIATRIAAIDAETQAS